MLVLSKFGCWSSICSRISLQFKNASLLLLFLFLKILAVFTFFVWKVNVLQPERTTNSTLTEEALLHVNPPRPPQCNREENFFFSFTCFYILFPSVSLTFLSSSHTRPLTVPYLIPPSLHFYTSLLPL